MQQQFLNVAQVCELLNIGKSAFYGLQRSNQFGVMPIKIGRRVLYSAAELDAYIRQSTLAGAMITRRIWQEQKKNFIGGNINVSTSKCNCSRT